MLSHRCESQPSERVRECSYPAWAWAWPSVSEVGVFSASCGDATDSDSGLGCVSGASPKSSAGGVSFPDTWSCAGSNSGLEGTGMSCLWNWESACGSTGSGVVGSLSDSWSGLVSVTSATWGFTVWHLEERIEGG